MKKIILLLSLIFSLSVLQVFCQNTELTVPQEKSSFFIHLDIPTIAGSPITTYDNNILQSYGLGIEYKFRNRFGLFFNFTRELNDFKYHNYDKRTTYNSFIYSPSLRYYVDSNNKFFINLGCVINSCNDKIIENNIINEEKYVQNAITTGIGYKAYFTEKKRLGMEFFISTKVFMWESERENYTRNTMLDDVLNFNISFFYRFLKLQ